MHAIERMQKECAQNLHLMQVQINPLIKGVQAEIDILQTLKDLCVATRSRAADIIYGSSKPWNSGGNCSDGSTIYEL